MAAILSSVSSSQRTPGSRAPLRRAQRMTRSGVTMRSRRKSWSVSGMRPVADDLVLVDGRDHDRVGLDQPGLVGEGVLQVAEAAALAEPGAVRRHRDAADHGEVDRLELVERRPAAVLRCALDRRRLAGCDRQRLGVEPEERLGPGEPGHGHEHGLAVLQRPLAHRHLRRVGVRPSASSPAPRVGARSRSAAASAPTKFGMRPSGFGNRRTPGVPIALHTSSRTAALAARTSASPPASWSCRLAIGSSCAARPDGRHDRSHVELGRSPPAGCG